MKVNIGQYVEGNPERILLNSVSVTVRNFRGDHFKRDSGKDRCEGSGIMCDFRLRSLFISN